MLDGIFFLPLGLGAAFWVLDQLGLTPVVEAFFLLLKFLGEFFSEHILWFMFGSLAAAIAYAFIQDYLDKRRW